MVLILVENLIYEYENFIAFLLFFFFLSISKNVCWNITGDFYSSAPLEDISAISNKLEGVVDFETGDFFFRIPINSFIFPSSLMQQHFNEKYMESDLYSISSLKGNFKEKIKLSQNQSADIKAIGVLNMHGVNQDFLIDTYLNVEDNQVQFHASFNVLLKDFKIKVPKIVRMNIADTILVNVSGNLITKSK